MTTDNKIEDSIRVALEQIAKATKGVHCQDFQIILDLAYFQCPEPDPVADLPVHIAAIAARVGADVVADQSEETEDMSGRYFLLMSQSRECYCYVAVQGSRVSVHSCSKPKWCGIKAGEFIDAGFLPGLVDGRGAWDLADPESCPEELLACVRETMAINRWSPAPPCADPPTLGINVTDETRTADRVG